MIINVLRSIMRTVCGHVGANRSAGEARASAPIRALLAAIVAFACVISVSSYASAEESGGGGGGHSFEGPNVGIIFYGPVPALDSNANQVTEVGVTAYSEFDAAAYVLGYSYGEVSSWSSDIRAKLSNSETGGRFWEFAKTFTHTSNIDGIQWFTANILYGADLCWRSLYSDELFRNALADCQTIINGGDIVGSGVTPLDGYKGFTCSMLDDISGNIKVYESTSMESSISVSVSDVKSNWGGAIYFKESTYNVLADFSDNYGGTGLASLVGGGRGYRSDSQGLYNFGMFVCVPSYAGTSLVVNSNTSGGLDVTATKTSNNSTGMVQWIPYNGSLIANVVKLADKYYMVCNVALSSMPTGNAYSKVTLQAYSFNGVDTGTPVIPPTQWPEEPNAPSPPELPEPGDPVVEPPEPYEPSTGPTYIWNITNTSEPTDTSSLLEWIKKIFYELKAIHSDLKTWFENLGDAITDGFEAMDNACGQIYGAITEQTDEMISQFSGLKDYLKQLFQWLKDQLSFQNDTFNDSNIVYWLKRIWSKLGSGDINLRPTDPTNDPDDWWDWLVKSIQNFLIGLAATSTELISEIADLASQVMHEFPFSIPWDIAAVLAALTTAPITPVFTVTVPAISGWWNAFDIVIDMSPFNGAAETIRLMEKLLFTGLLIWKSKELLDFMDVTRWFD